MSQVVIENPAINSLLLSQRQTYQLAAEERLSHPGEPGSQRRTGC